MPKYWSKLVDSRRRYATPFLLFVLTIPHGTARVSSWHQNAFPSTPIYHASEVLSGHHIIDCTLWPPREFYGYW
ncbi:hypothetical protein GGS24DRAFT_460207 [Hypoxylon argillaceum]|nr:hypothetical protein GGS24DRAFT_460207 [Hypoxylon argillaceum]